MARSKYDYEDSLFQPEPPANPRLVKKLFCGRDTEIEAGHRTLLNNLDIRGSRAKTHDKKPWVIHGESRTGKSHLARLILTLLPKGSKRLQLFVAARERLEAQRVLENLFETLRDEFQVRIAGRSLELAENPWIRLTTELIEHVSYFLRGMESVTLKVSQDLREGLEAGARLSVVPKVVEFYGKLGSQRTVASATELRLRPPNPRDLAEYCSLMVDTLVQIGAVDHVLALVDDVDLIDGYADPQRNGRIQRSILSEALDQFHATPGVDVLVTARSWYAHSRKDFRTLVDLTTSEPLTPEQLVEIHNRRFAAFGKKKLPMGFLTQEALDRAASDVEGIPGVFLQHLDTAFYHYKSEPEWGHRDYAWYVGVFRRIYEIYRDKVPQAAMALENAVQSGSKLIDVAADNPFHDTVFDNQFIFQSYFRETSYFMDGLTRRIVQSYLDETGAPPKETGKTGGRLEP